MEVKKKRKKKIGKWERVILVSVWVDICVGAGVLYKEF